MHKENSEEYSKVAVIMAGGIGAKLWPRSREHSPKQFNHFIGEGTMIQNTIFRLLPFFELQDIYIVTNKNLRQLIEDQVPQIPKENIIVEPFGKNTAPCLEMASTFIEKSYPEDTVIMAFPSDHVIANLREFHDSLGLACSAAHSLKGIITIGIKPTGPETGYGYVQFRDKAEGLDKFYENGVRSSATFAEKPDLATAKRFLDSGDFLWNSGIFAWRLDTFRKALNDYLPDQTKLFQELRDNFASLYFNELAEDVYRQIQAVSVDYAILEKADNVFVVKSTFEWSDLGNWDEIYRLSMKDARNNLIEGNVIALNTSNCFINATDKTIGIVGVKDLIVIEEDDSIMICRRGATDDILEIVNYLRRKQINHLL